MLLTPVFFYGLGALVYILLLLGQQGEILPRSGSLLS